MDKPKMRLKKKRKKKKSSPTTQFGIFDRGSLKHIDALQVALLRAGKDTLLPEIYDIFGKDKLLKFLDIFSGATIRVPPRKVLEDSIRDTYVYLTMEKREKSLDWTVSVIIALLSTYKYL